MRIGNVAPHRRAPFRVDTVLRIGGSEDSPADEQFGAISSVALDSSGRIVVVDVLSQNLRVYDRRGRFLAVVGRTGEGPGEFRLPTKVSVAPDGGVLVFDQSLNRTTEFSSRLAFVRSIRMSVPITVSGFVATHTLLIFSGRTRAGGPAARSSIHVFDRGMGRYLYSFGQVPPSSVPAFVGVAEVGRITRAPDGSIWYASPAPYRIEKYTTRGQLLLRIERANRFLPPVDSSVRVARSGRRLTITSDPHPRAVLVRELLEGGLVHQVLRPDGNVVTDWYSPVDTRADPDGPTLLHSWIAETPILSEQLAPGLFVVQLGGRNTPYGVGVIRLSPRSP